MVLLVADLNGVPSASRSILLHLANGMDTPSSYLTVINTPLLMQFKGKIQVTLHYFWVGSPPLEILKCHADVALRDIV